MLTLQENHDSIFKEILIIEYPTRDCLDLFVQDSTASGVSCQMARLKSKIS